MDPKEDALVEEETLVDEIDRMVEPPRKKPLLTAELLRLPLSSLDPSPPLAVPVTGSVRDAVDLMKAHRFGAVTVVDAEGRVVGIFTERDLLLRVIDPVRDWREIRIADFMTPDPECLSAHEKIAYALNYMHLGGYRHVPIVDEERRPVGFVTARSVVAYLAELFGEDVCNLPPDPRHTVPTTRYGG
jgi:CBS domain-containing protein